MAQTLPVDEIIVWDDGSTDNTAEVVDTFGDSVRYFKAPNAGKAAALNAALKAANGDYIWIVDDDDVPCTTACEDLLRAMVEHNTLIAAGSFQRFRLSEDGDKILMPPSYWPDLSSGSTLRHLLEECFIFQPGMLVHRSCYSCVGGFREDLPRSIDYDMLVRLALHTPIAVTEQTVFEQREHVGGRGPGHARHQAGEMLDVWRENDKAVFAELASKLTIDLFETMYAANDPSVCRRAALLQRACVWARRVLWDRAIEDLEQAASAAPAVALSRVERAILHRAMSGKHFDCSAIDGTLTDRFAVLRARCPVGQDIVVELARGMAWRLRKAATAGQLRQVGELARCARRISGAAILHPIRRLGRGHTRADVREVEKLAIYANAETSNDRAHVKAIST